MATRGRAAAQQGAAGAVAAARPVQTQFALAPALHPQQAGYIDYGTKEGQKLFYETWAPLPLKNKFDRSKGDSFLARRARTHS